MIISDVAIRNRVTVAVLVLLIIVAGAIAYATLPRESAPDVPIPIVLVSTTHEGISPQDIETSVTMKIEKKLTGIKGIKEVRSGSAEGLSTIIVEFQPGIRIEDAVQSVRDKVDQAQGDLPTDAEDPSITEINIADFPIMQVNISGDVSPVQLKEIADRLEDRFEQITGVLNAEVIGALEPEVRLEIDQDRVAMYGLTVPEILSLIPAENVNISAGGLETPGTRFNVRVPAEFQAGPKLAGEVDHLLLTVRDGRPIYLGDVATVRSTFKDRSTFSRLNASPSISVAIQKRIGADIPSVAAEVKAVLAAAQKQVPAGVKFELTLDSSTDIKRMVADLENNIAAALVLVLVVLLIFMGLRAAIVVALAVPLSMLMSFAIISALGYTLNMVVLFSLVLAVGMLVDNAIVIVENIYRHMQIGYGRIEAAMKGTSEVAWPIITSTLTTVAAFIPMLFWPGIMGDFMKYLPITVIIVLMSSMFVAMVISPVICTLVVAKPKEHNTVSTFYRGYRNLLQLAMDHRKTTLTLSVMLLAGLIAIYGKLGHGVEFFPSEDPKNAMINVRAPQGTNIIETDRISRVIEERIMHYVNEGKIVYVTSNVGSSGGAGAIFGGSSGGPNIANIPLVFPEFEVRQTPSSQVVAEIRDALVDIPGAEIKVAKEEGGPPTGAAISVRLSGEDFGKLQQFSEQAKALMSGIPGLVNLRSDLEATRPELVFTVDRQKAMLSGVNTAIIGNFLKTAVFGNRVGSYRQFNDEYDITVRLPESQRSRVDDLFRLRVPNAQGQAVPLSSLGDFEYRGGLGTINRVNQRRVVNLTGDAEGRLAEDVLKDVQARLAKLELPQDYDVKYVGQKEEQEQSSKFLAKAFVFAVLLIALILVAQFNTLSVPLIIMTTVVLSLIGVLLGLIAHGMPFGIVMTGIGVISLAGVVVNNAIVLLDYTRQLQKRGMGVVEAAVEAGVTRLRPVLLTACTTVIGLLPTALGMSFDFHTFEWAWRSESSQWWKSMAVAIIYGMSFATILTLVVVPALYVMTYRLAASLGLGGLKKVNETVNP